MSNTQKYWCFSNYGHGYYDDNDWDISTIINSKRYYFNQAERNSGHISTGDLILLREYGAGFHGTCKIAGEWAEDNEAEERYHTRAGWFPIDEIEKWDALLPYEVIRSELSNQDHRSRIIRLKASDFSSVALAYKVYKNLGYGSTEGNFFLLESGLEEAVKQNISQLDLELADDSIQQQCSMGVGVGRSDLICRDKSGDYVVLELKANRSSDEVVGQILRYMGYVRENWARKESKQVKGIILTPSFNEQLRLAAAEANITVLRFRII